MSPISDSSAKPGNDPSGRLSRQDDAIIEAAWCYYHEGLNQSEIAKKLDVSRASVVNYLAESRRRQYVRVTLDSDLFLRNQLAEDLIAAYGLEEALVIPADDSDETRSVERVLRAASDWLPQLLSNGDLLGVAWGETIYRFAEIAPKHPFDDLMIIQLVGSGPSARGFTAENCSSMLAERFSAQCVNLHVPLCLSNAELCEALINEPVISEQLDLVRACDKVIFAAGTCFDDSHIVRTGLINKKEMASYRKKGAVGVICGRLIDSDGQPIPISVEDRMIGVSLDEMRAKQTKILVSAEAGRVDAARAAIVGGYVSHFATSSDTARRLLESAPK